MTGWADRPTLNPGSYPDGAQIEAILDQISALSLLPLTVLKTADESLPSSTTLQDDNELFLTPDISTNYVLDGLLLYTAATAGDFKMGYTFPSGATLHFANVGYVSGGSFTIDLTAQLTATSGTSTLTYEGGSGNMAVHVRGTLLMGTTAGNLQLQWAQGTSSGTATVVKAGSWLRLTKVP